LTLPLINGKNNSIMYKCQYVFTFQSIYLLDNMTFYKQKADKKIAGFLFQYLSLKKNVLLFFSDTYARYCSRQRAAHYFEFGIFLRHLTQTAFSVILCF